MSETNQGGDPILRVETRSIASSKSDGRNLSGYAILYNTDSRLLWENNREFTEQIARGAFDESIATSETDIKLYYNHDSSMPLARTSNGSLKIVSDAQGLRFSAVIPNTTLGNDLIELLQTRTLTGEMSFGFYATRDTWSSNNTKRTIEKGRLLEISLVVDAAYPSTSSSLRNQTEINQKRINSFRRKCN